MNHPAKFSNEKILIVGNDSSEHIGAHLLRAAAEMDLKISFQNVSRAFVGNSILKKCYWHFCGHRPVRLRQFSRDVCEACREFRPRWLLAVGMAPLDKSALTKIGSLGTVRLNYLTDDPWSSKHRAPWFMRALPNYDYIFSTRKSNLADLENLGCSSAIFLPFAYAPEIHFPEPAKDFESATGTEFEIVFFGHADRDRVPYISALIKAGFKVGLYGNDWNRFPETRAHARGQADPEKIRSALGAAKVVLCLVRRMNRDGNSMRTFEVPAMGGCMLLEDTQEHREIFGQEGEAVIYFKTVDEMLMKVQYLLSDEEARKRLALASHQLILNGHHTYKDRLLTMLRVVSAEER